MNGFWQNIKIYLSPVFLLIFLGENRVHPPDLCKHAAIGQTEAEPEQPQAELKRKKIIFSRKSATNVRIISFLLCYFFFQEQTHKKIFHASFMSTF